MTTQQQTNMGRFLVDRGWIFSGSCNCAAQQSKWLHPDYPDWRIKTGGNKTMTKDGLNHTNHRPAGG